MPAIPQSEVLAKFFRRDRRKMRRNFGEIFRWFSSFDFQGKWPQKNSHKKKNPRHFPRRTKLSFFSLLQLWGPRGPIIFLSNGIGRHVVWCHPAIFTVPGDGCWLSTKADLRVLSATLILSKNSCVLDATSRLKSANLGWSRLKSAKIH